MARMAPRRRRAHHGPPARLIGDPGVAIVVAIICAVMLIGYVLIGDPAMTELPVTH